MLRKRHDNKSGGLRLSNGAPRSSTACADDNSDKRHERLELFCIFLSLLLLSILAACLESAFVLNVENNTPVSNNRAIMKRQQDKDDSSITSRFHHQNTTSTSMDMIVNHCKEDLSWIPMWMSSLKINNTYIYDKCGEPPIFNDKNIHVMELPNTGREGSSWLHHMMRNDIYYSYSNIFLQGNHETTLQVVQDALNDIRLQQERIDFVDFSRHASRGPFVGGCFTDDGLCARYLPVKEICNFHDEYSSTGRSCQDAIASVRGEFYVSSETMLNYVNDYRTKLKSLQEKLNMENDPIVGHYLERNWGEMFGGYGNVLLLDRNVNNWREELFANFRRFFRFCGDTDVCHIHGSKAD